jgi:hypothetical protein
MESNNNTDRYTKCRRFGRLILISILWIVLAGCILWAFGALHFDFPFLSSVFAWGFIVAVVSLMYFVKGIWKKLAAVFGGFVLVLVWWLCQSPPKDGDWQADVTELPRAEINGDVVTIHNVRRCDYKSNKDYTPQWETRTVRLSQLTGIDMAICYWGSPYMAHPIVSFQFADSPPICFSIETRKLEGQSYSAIGGLYRQYNLIYIAADERDVISVRTTFREGEDVYLYRLNMTADQARTRFLEYIESINDLNTRPRWYNAITTNCTTAIRHQHQKHGGNAPPWDWRMLVNGKGDELMFERGVLKTDGLSFAELKKLAHINEAAVSAGDSSDFSSLIRLNRPGMKIDKSN